jgi:hypothetical protein
VTKQWSDSVYHVVGTVNFSATTDNYAAGGITFNLGQAAIKAQRVPLSVKIWPEAHTSAQALYDYTYVPGTDVTNGKIKIFTAGAEATDAQALPTHSADDVLNFEATWLGML